MEESKDETDIETCCAGLMHDWEHLVCNTNGSESTVKVNRREKLL